MKKLTTESLKKEIAKREWDEKAKKFKKMLGLYFTKAGEKGVAFSMFTERTPDFPVYFNPTKVVPATGLIERTPSIEGEYFTLSHDGSKYYQPKHSEFWESDWKEITRSEYEKARKDFCASFTT